MIEGIAGVVIWTEDLDRLLDFYRDTLGLTPHSVRPEFVAFKWGEMRLSIGNHSEVRGRTSEPHRIMMATAHSVDVMGARSCGYRAAWVNRGALPFDETHYRPDIITDDLAGLASSLLDDTMRDQVREVA